MPKIKDGNHFIKKAVPSLITGARTRRGRFDQNHNPNKTQFLSSVICSLGTGSGFSPSAGRRNLPAKRAASLIKEKISLEPEKKV
jgi:hypothetical protein